MTLRTMARSVANSVARAATDEHLGNGARARLADAAPRRGRCEDLLLAAVLATIGRCGVTTLQRPWWRAGSGEQQQAAPAPRRQFHGTVGGAGAVLIIR